MELRILGEAIRQRMKWEGLTVKRASQVMGISENTLKKWINNNALPSARFRAVLCHFLRISEKTLTGMLELSRQRMNERNGEPVRQKEGTTELLFLGEALERKIEAEELSLCKAAKMIGVALNTINGWINGSCTPKANKHAVLCRFLDLDESRFMRRGRRLYCWVKPGELPSAYSMPKNKPETMVEQRPELMIDEQIAVLCCIDRYTDALGRSPWYGEISRTCRLDLDGVRRVMNTLARLGFVKFGRVHFAITSKGREAARKLKA